MLPNSKSSPLRIRPVPVLIWKTEGIMGLNQSLFLESECRRDGPSVKFYQSKCRPKMNPHRSRREVVIERLANFRLFLLLFITSSYSTATSSADNLAYGARAQTTYVHNRLRLVANIHLQLML